MCGVVRILPRHAASQLHENPTLWAPPSVLVASLQSGLSATSEDRARFGEDVVSPWWVPSTFSSTLGVNRTCVLPSLAIICLSLVY